MTLNFIFSFLILPLIHDRTVIIRMSQLFICHGLMLELNWFCKQTGVKEPGCTFAEYNLGNFATVYHVTDFRPTECVCLTNAWIFMPRGDGCSHERLNFSSLTNLSKFELHSCHLCSLNYVIQFVRPRKDATDCAVCVTVVIGLISLFHLVSVKNFY